jgi:hypothetical protein
MDLELQYTPAARQESAPDGPVTRSPSMADFNSLIHIQPLVLPLKSSLQTFIKRFVRRNLLRQLPLVFNSQWKKVITISIYR